MNRPLSGIRVIEMAGIGPAPFCAMMLADMGAEVIRIDRMGSSLFGNGGTLVDRGKRSIAMDIKQTESKAILEQLISKSDILIEGFRPGVMEKLGLGPEDCLVLNPKLIYGRMTGWGQTGPLAPTAGHDLNYIAISGALHAMGKAGEPPTPPLHLVGDMGGGSMMLAYGIVCALFEAQRSGTGQVVDAAICNGASTLSTMYYALMQQGIWTLTREDNLLDGGAPFYACYRCADDKYVAVGAIEPQFYQLLLERGSFTDPIFQDQMNKSLWPAQKQRFTELFLTKTQAEWCELLEGTDACFSPVLNFEEAAQYPHNQARDAYITLNGVTCPAPSPRLSRTPAVAGEVTATGSQTTDILTELGYTEDEIQGFRAQQMIY